jgi:hypothetical protein
LSGRGNPADKTDAHWDSILSIKNERRLANAVVNVVFAAGNQMQTACLVRASRLLWTTRANVAFSNQPGFHPRKFRVGHRRAKRFLHQPLERPLLGNVEQQTRSKIEIESGVIAFVTGRLHNQLNMPSGMNFQLKIGLKNQMFDISTQTENGQKMFK